MKKYLVTSVLLTCLISVTTSFNGYGQTKDTVYFKDGNGITHQAVLRKTDDGWYYYEMVFDSSKYYYHRYLLLKNKGVPDSINHWYWMLKKLKK